MIRETAAKVSRWWIMLAFAAVSLIIGILTLLRAFIFGAENQHLFIGIFMLGEAVLDIVTYVVIRLGMKKLAGQKDEEKDEMYNTALEAAETAALEAVKTAALNAARGVETPDGGGEAE